MTPGRTAIAQKRTGIMPEAHRAPIGVPKLGFIVMRRRDIVRASPTLSFGLREADRDLANNG